MLASYIYHINNINLQKNGSFEEDMKYRFMCVWMKGNKRQVYCMTGESQLG